MSDRDEEKRRLWEEVMSKDRSGNSDRTEEVHLTLEEDASTPKKTVRSADRALEELNAILQKQRKDLEAMSREIRKPNPIVNIDNDMEELEKNLRNDYGIQTEKPTETSVKKDIDSKEIFRKVDKDLSEKVIGQDPAIQALSSAFRRPYVMGSDGKGAKNVILVMGPHGSGRHAAVSALARSLYEQQVFLSDEVYTIDLSRYTSGAQEQVFLQDLYQAINGNGGIICFENFSSGFPAFLRMVSSLATEGSVVLNKRYVLSKGILVENQTGLVKESVDSLSASGKYLVFLTSGKISGVQDAFGADFMYHVLDTITFEKLSDDTIRKIIERQIDSLIDKCKDKMKITVTCEPTVREWILEHYDKEHGADAIVAMCSDFYVNLSQVLMTHGDVTEIVMRISENIPTAVFEGGSVSLTRSKTSQEEIDAVNKELDNIVGLDKVKAYIRSLQAHVQVQQRRKEQGMKTSEISKHMIFTGNPGTGKTTIARLISRYMKAIGALSQGQLVEVTRADLVAQYVGQTAPLTMSVIRSAIGGVLFVDEAYSLYRGKDDSFGLEAIDTLVKAMEDNRDDLIVILAGYSKEMSVFLESNSGLKSRFPNLIEFPDYTGEELEKIAVIQAKSKGYMIAEDALKPLQEYFDKVQGINSAEAGNGRLARNVVEDAILKQSERLISQPDAAMDELRKEDFDFEVKVKPKE